MMVCPDCGCSVLLVVDGKPMSQYELLALRRAPRSIERKVYHDLRCPSIDNRLSLEPITSARHATPVANPAQGQ